MLPYAKVSKGVHPTYDIFNTKEKKIDIPSLKKELHLKEKTILFFGFVRPYKGLQYLLEAMPFILKKLESQFPKIRKEILHGKVGEKHLVETMRDFREGKIKILLSTTIIENGLDISSVNTLVVEDATKLGLSQSHQLRGRVGRTNIQAYAYFLYPSQKLTPRAEERLEALLSFQELGAGMEIAKRDLELRGAGNILGREQTGVLNKIGWNLYFEMLGQTLEEMM